MSYGMAGYLGIAKETTWGTPVSPQSFSDLMSENVAVSIDRFDTRNVFNGTAEPDDSTGLVRIEGDTVVACDPQNIGHFLMAALGTCATTSLAAGTYKQHVFQCLDSDISSVCVRPPYTLELFRDVTSAQQYAGMNCTMLTLACQPNQDLRATAHWIGKTMTHKSRVAAASVLFPTSPGNPFTFDTCSISIAGVATDLIEGFNIEIDNQAEAVAALNASTAIARIRRQGPATVKITGQIDFTDISQYLDFVNQTERAFSINFNKAASFQCLISLPRVKYTTFPLGMGGRGRQVVSFEGKAFVPTGSVSAIAVTLKNTSLAY